MSSLISSFERGRSQVALCRLLDILRQAFWGRQAVQGRSRGTRRRFVVRSLQGFCARYMTNTEPSNQLVVFTLDQQKYGLPLSCVVRAVLTVELTPLPKTPDIVRGVINVQGQLIPVIDLRRRFRLPRREIALSDQIVIARAELRTVGLMVDSVVGVLTCAPEQIVHAGEILPVVDYIEGVVKLEDGLLLIHDLAKCLSIDEAHALDEAITGVSPC